MTLSELLEYCLSKNGAYIDHPFGPESDIIKVEGKIFAQLFVLKGIETATLNCERMTEIFTDSCIRALSSEDIIVLQFNSHILIPFLLVKFLMN